MLLERARDSWQALNDGVEEERRQRRVQAVVGKRLDEKPDLPGLSARAVALATEFDKWRAYNWDMLCQLGSTDYLAGDYNGAEPSILPRGESRPLHVRVQYHLDKLESIRDRLHLFVAAGAAPYDASPDSGRGRGAGRRFLKGIAVVAVGGLLARLLWWWIVGE